MKSSTHSNGKTLDFVQRRFIRSRPGSVLILVVALLVLMALIGTAYMTMAQFDRISSVQHGFNTEVDLLIDGVTNQVEGVVTSSLFVNGQYRSAIPNAANTTTTTAASSYNQPGEYNYFDGVGMDVGTILSLNSGAVQLTSAMNPGDWWLASRLPDYESIIVGSLPSLLPKQSQNPIGTPAWAYITGPINGNQYFDTPYWPAGTQVQYTSHVGINLTMEASGLYAVSNLMAPTSITINGAAPFPAFNVAPMGSAAATPILAADADGDGIADSGLVKILALDGVTYYAAVRIIDNCAAINASIATRPNPFAAPSTTTPSVGSPLTYVPGEFSPANVDLEGILISPAAELYGSTGLLNWRFNSLTPSSAGIDANGVARNDFYWMTYPYSGTNLFFDQQWAQLGSRLDNPGNVILGSPTTSSSLFQALPITESMTLAHEFCVCDPNVQKSPASSPSILEQKMPNSLVQYCPTTPYLASNTNAWIRNLAYNSTGINTNTPDRAVLVARNPVSNFCPAKFFDQGVSSTGIGAYRFGDMITYPATSSGHRYVCINPNPTAAPIIPGPLSTDPYWSDPNWAFEPWTSAPAKTSINTATFQQLYAAYWAVMADQYVNVNGVAQWEPAFYNAPNAPANTVNRMFRSPTRTTSNTPTTTLTPQQVMYLRAALAAVNTMDLRDSDDDVTSRTIVIPDATGKPAFQANVYGAEKQPYITQVYALNDPTAANDWVGIELYNPYNTPIVMTNWELQTLDRTTSPLTMGTTPIPIPATQIPAQGRVVLISSASQTNVTLPTSGVKLITIDKLNTVFGKEVVILKPRLANGTLIKSTTANNVFDEVASADGDDLIPVDSYDFTNLPATVASSANVQYWSYIRPSAPAENWHFVYPGPWNTNAATATPPAPTLGGTATQVAPSLPVTPPLGTAQTTVAQGNMAMVYKDCPLQVNNTDFGGPNKSIAATGNVFPYGGFPRNGDMLQVTYVGAYKLSPYGSPHVIIELNSLSMDSAMATAQDGDAGDDKPYQPIVSGDGSNFENIGRFCPIDTTNAGTSGVNDFNDTVLSPATNGTASTILSHYRYHWAMRLFDYLTVMSPQDDYTPNVDPWFADADYGANSAFPYGGQAERYAGANSQTMVPVPVPNVLSSVANAGLPSQFSTNLTEDTAPTQGLININSAPWRVLAALPWQPQGSNPGNYRAINAEVAQAVAYYRDVDDGTGQNNSNNPIHGHGPFKSIFELNEALLPLNATLVGTADPTAAQGNLRRLYTSATPLATDQVTGDFETQFNVMTRVSNLITTRSDSYTAYILVQGWRNAETNNPTLVVQRRATIILDRSAITPLVTTPTVYNVPN